MLPRNKYYKEVKSMDYFPTISAKEIFSIYDVSQVNAEDIY
jgi:hypothetical protein